MVASGPVWQATQDEQRQKTGGSVASCRHSRGLAHAGSAIRGLELQVALDELAETFAVFVTHVDEFHAGAFLADIANHGGESDFAKAGAHFQLDGVAHSKFLRRLEGSASRSEEHTSELQSQTKLV